uniref:Uncharacterized protein MANES_18G076700 n=1 Tax=Rhizophora mucronata TaxID=61149 RepID=A0A2P2M3P2_RHIMU
MSSIITQHLHRATVSNILTLFEKYGLVVSASSMNTPRRSLNMSLRYLSSKGGSGANIRNNSLMQMATKSLTSLSVC